MAIQNSNVGYLPSKWLFFTRERFKRLGFYVILAIGTLVVWSIVAAFSKPVFFPNPLAVLKAFRDLLADGSLIKFTGVSYARILSGWFLGSIIGIPIGLIAGRINLARKIMEPYIQFFRFIPPIAFVTLSLIWFGMGETSKIVLIIYTTTFIVILNTMAGVMNVEKEKIRAGQCLGATNKQIIINIVIPATIPYIITGMRLAMGNSFMTVASAEMIAAQSGIGFLIFNARLFMQTDQIFVGIITLGLMGLVADFLFNKIVQKLFYRYQVKGTL